jgi:hypothetical protein
MKKPALVLALLFFVPASMALADWIPEDGHKMHEPQLPDPNGWAVSAYNDQRLSYPVVLADDWMCTSSGYVEDIHFWGAWKQGIEGDIESFWIAIHEDIPEGPNGFSIPGEMLWFREVPNWEFEYTNPIAGDEGWYDPVGGIYEPNDHELFYQYNIFLGIWIPPEEMFYQEAGHVYWLAITAILDVPENHGWGWKSSLIHYRDNAVWSNDWLEWSELYEPEVIPDPITNWAVVAIRPDGEYDVGEGDDAYGDGWYYYENTDWWNIWFYDHPFDPTRMKHLWMNGSVVPWEGGPAWVEVAFNWSTPEWPPGEPPPIPPLDPVEEEQYIQRETIFAGELTGPVPIEAFFEILDYNPEWVSIDVRGYNFVFDGELTHQCLPRDPQGEPLDLAFVINGHGEDIPTLNEWGMIILGLLIVTIGTIAVVRRRKKAISEAA